jgi:hypothetical protein
MENEGLDLGATIGYALTPAPAYPLLQIGIVATGRNPL